MLSLIFLIALIVATAKYTSDIKPHKEQIIEKGVDEELFDIYLIGLWLYFVPPLLAFIFPLAYRIYTIPLLAAFYLPSIIIGIKISNQLDRGYDYVRKIGKKINQTVWIGYGGIALVFFNWFMIYLSTKVIQS